ncbi:PQ-loop repeat-containing protein [Candidatus Dependentiae bacterium]
MNCNFFAYCATWIAQILFCVSLFPQIKLNYQLKTVSGCSDFFLIGYLNGYITYIYYVYFLHFPLAYKVMVPIACVLIFIILFQRFYYSEFKRKDKFWAWVYILNISLALLIFPFTINNSYLVGTFCGWLMLFIWATYQIPQLIKCFSEKSVYGFSFALVSLIALGEVVELLGALALGLPFPTIINNFRGILIYLVFCVQFLFYKSFQIEKVNLFIKRINVFSNIDI